MLGLIGIGPGQDQPIARQVCEGRPDLLTVQDPLVAIAHSPRGQTCDVGASSRLREQLAPDLLTGEEAAQVLRLLLCRAVDRNGRCDHAVADDVVRGRHRRTSLEESAGDVAEERGAGVESPTVTVEVDPGQTPIELGAEELDVPRRRRREVGEELVDHLIDVLDGQLLVSNIGHGAPFDRTSRQVAGTASEHTPTCVMTARVPGRGSTGRTPPRGGRREGVGSVDHEELAQLLLANLEVLQGEAALSQVLVDLGQLEQDL